jgi:hypothetical protein
MTIKIDKGVESPSITIRGKRTKILMSMEPGDSFLDEGKTIQTSKWYNSAKKLNIRKEGVTFAGRTVEGGVRIWRTK